jgi:hypothetical protein
VSHPAAAGRMQSRSPPAERRPRFGAKPGGATKYPWPDLRIYRRSGRVAFAMRYQMYMGASARSRRVAQNMAVLVAHVPVAWIFRHPAPEQGGAPPNEHGLTCGDASRTPPQSHGAPPNTHGFRSSEAPTRGRLVGGSGTHGATGAARRDRPQVTERNPGTAPQRRRRGGGAARSSGGVRVASAASGARGPTGRPRNWPSRRRRLQRDDGGATKYPWTTRGKPPRVVSPSVDDAERAPGSGRALLEPARKVLTRTQGSARQHSDSRHARSDAVPCRHRRLGRCAG